MADFIPPSDLFHLGPVLDEIRSNIATLLGDRDILIANQNAQQTELTQILAAQQQQVSAIASGSAQLNANLNGLKAETEAKFDSLATTVGDLGTSLSGQIGMFNTNLVNLIALLEAMIQAFQGVGTLDAQNQIVDLLTEIIQATSPEKPVSIRADLTHVATTPQPRPDETGP